MSRTYHRTKEFSYSANESAKQRTCEKFYKKLRTGRERMLGRCALSHNDFNDLSEEKAFWDYRETLKENEWWG